MLTLNSAHVMIDALSGKPAHPASLNEDVIAHEAAKPLPEAEHWTLRLLPGVLRAPLKARIAARAQERALIRVWSISPHLLDDLGVVLTASGKLPDHLVAAPARVIAHVAAAAPEQIVAAELRFAPPATTDVTGIAGGKGTEAFPLSAAI